MNLCKTQKNDFYLLKCINVCRAERKLQVRMTSGWGNGPLRYRRELSGYHKLSLVISKGLDSWTCRARLMIST